MLKDKLSLADEQMHEGKLREALATCPRLVDLIARGWIADPDAEAIIYLRSPRDESPVTISGDHLIGYIKAAEDFFRAEGVGTADPVAILLPNCPEAIVAIFGAASYGIAEPLNLLFTREAIAAQLNAIKAKLLLTLAPGMPGGLYEKVEGLQKDVPSLERILTTSLDGTMAFDDEVLTPDPALARRLWSVR